MNYDLYGLLEGNCLVLSLIIDLRPCMHTPRAVYISSGLNTPQTKPNQSEIM